MTRNSERARGASALCSVAQLARATCSVSQRPVAHPRAPLNFTARIKLSQLTKVHNCAHLSAPPRRSPSQRPSHVVVAEMGPNTPPPPRHSSSTITASPVTTPSSTSPCSTSPSNPRTPPPRPQTPTAKLPRCAVVNFRKDGSSLAWAPRLSHNRGGIAARVHNFEDAFSLEEFSSRALNAPVSMRDAHNDASAFGNAQPRSLHLSTPSQQHAALAAATPPGAAGVNASQPARVHHMPQQHQPQQQHKQYTARQRANNLRASGGIRRSAISFFKRLLQRERTCRNGRTADKARQQSAQHACLSPRFHERVSDRMARKISDSTVTDESDEMGEGADAGRVRFEHKSKSVWRACSPVQHSTPKRRIRSSMGARPMPMLRRRMHKQSELGTSMDRSATEAAPPQEDPYVRFITSVM